MNTDKIVSQVARMLNSRSGDYSANADEHIEWCEKHGIDLTRDCDDVMDHHYIGAQIAQRRRQAEVKARRIVSFIKEELKK